MPKTHGAPTQVVRAVRILRHLQGRRLGARLDDLADELGVTRSQIRRDLLAIEEAGVHLAFDQEEGRYGRARVRLIDAEWVAISRRERFTLLAARRMFDIFRGTPLFEDIDAVFDRITDTLTDAERRDLRALASRVLYLPSGGTKTYDDDQTRDIIDALQTGVLHDRLVRYRYQPRHGPASSGTLAPYALVLYRNGLYIIASRHLSTEVQAPRVFAIERFLEAEPIRRSTFARPPDLAIDTLFDGAFGLITGKHTHHVIAILPRSARPDSLTRRWHPTQQTTELPDGRVRIEFHVTSLREVLPWALEWQAHILSPPDLRRRAATWHASEATRYEENQTP